MAEWVEGRVIAKRQWADHLFSVLIDAEIETFKAGQFTRVGLDIGGERVGRPYSFVNAPHERPLEIYFNIVPEGPLSSHLASLRSGDPIYVLESANGHLILDEVPQSRDLWMLATGTAIGPFLSILKTREPWERFDRVVLVHAVRWTAELTYQDVIRKLEDEYPDQLTFIPFVSRESTDFALSGRIPAAITGGSLEERAGLHIHPETSQVMLCGNSAMINDTTAALEARGLSRNRRRRPGQITTEKYH
jgi:ferredoxin--NADP+ reductase